MGTLLDSAHCVDWRDEGVVKVTWFGGRTLRVHAGGEIAVIREQADPAGFDARELVSGADHVWQVDAAEDRTDLASWRPRRAASVLEQGEADAPDDAARYHAGEGSGLFEVPGEPPLLLVWSAPPELGRWLSDAVTVVMAGTGEAAARHGAALIGMRPPRLILLAVPAAEVDAAFDALAPFSSDTGLMVLEPALGLEV
jgi:hypothetical protein